MFKWAADHPDAAAAIAIAAVSLGFSAFVFWRQTSLQERVTRIEEERREEERRSQQRADVTVECSSRGERSRVAHTLLDYFLVLHNRGPAVARNVNLRAELLDGSTTLPSIRDNGLLPVPLLDSGQRYPMAVDVAMGDAIVFDVVVTWEDDEGPKEKRLRTNWH